MGKHEKTQLRVGLKKCFQSHELNQKPSKCLQMKKGFQL